MQMHLEIPAGTELSVGERIEIETALRDCHSPLIELSPHDVPKSAQRQLRMLTWEDSRPDLVFTPNGRFAAVPCGMQIVIINCRRGRMTGLLSGHVSRFSDLSFSRSDPILAAITTDGVLYLWNWQQGKTITSLAAHSAGRNRVAYSLDGFLLATADDKGHLRYWQSGRRVVLSSTNSA